MGKIYGGNLRGKFAGKIYGENLRGKFTGKFKRKIYGKTKVESTSLLIPLKNNNFCLR
jgi:hypothetical protein